MAYFTILKSVQVQEPSGWSGCVRLLDKFTFVAFQPPCSNSLCTILACFSSTLYLLCYVYIN